MGGSNSATSWGLAVAWIVLNAFRRLEISVGLSQGIANYYLEWENTWPVVFPFK